MILARVRRAMGREPPAVFLVGHRFTSETLFFLAGLLALWMFWFGLGEVVVEFRALLRNAHADGVLRSIPYVHHTQKGKE